MDADMPEETVEEEVELPELGELVVATVTKVTRYGAYLRLEDYPCDGFLHISEISSRWIRKVRDILRVRQKIVVKVVRVDERTRSADVSLKDVPPSDRRKVMRDWKKNIRGETFLKEYSEKANLDLEELEEGISSILNKYTNLYDALERMVVEPSILEKTGLSEEGRKDILEFLSRRIKPRKYEFQALIEVIFKGKGGVYRLREVLGKVIEAVEEKGLEATILSTGAPRYLVKISSYKPELLRRHAEKIISSELKRVERMGGKASLVEKGEKIKI
jgi:translation initiation factor 2 subunit 1